MGESDAVSEVSEKAENGTSTTEKSVQDVTARKEESGGVKKLEEAKMDEDLKLEEEDGKKEKESRKGEKEEKETKAALMEVEAVPKEQESKVEEKGEEKVEEAGEPKGEVDRVEESKEIGSKRRGKGQSAARKVQGKAKAMGKKEPEQRTPAATDRPVRERKSVERLVATIEKGSVKELQIEKGRGTPLREIPNVAFKMSRRKTDDTFKLLHSILYGRRGKQFQIKSNISRFSGFVWDENEEKQRAKIKEKFDKCNKEKLLEFCDILDIPVAKASTRKEEIVTKLIDFLVEPHATTTVLLAGKEKSSKGTKRKRTVRRSSSASGSARTAKSRKKSDSSKREKNAPETESDSEGEKSEDEEHEEADEENEEANENGAEEKSEDEAAERSETEEKTESEDDESDDHSRKGKEKSKAASRKNGSATKAKNKKAMVSKKSTPPPKKSSVRSSSKRAKDDDVSDGSPKVSSRENKNKKAVKEKKSSTPAKSKPSVPAKSASKEKAVKNVVKGKDKKTKAKKAELTDDELRDAICELLKQVDINKATFTDILKQLAEQYKTDLTPRKQSIKLLIQEELTKLADDADEEDDGEGDDSSDEDRMEETKGAGEGVKA